MSSDDEKTIAVYDQKKQTRPVEPPPRTLLPSPLANLITYGTNGASLFIKSGTKIAGWAIAGSRESTLTSIELARAAVEIILTRAGKDVADRRSTELGRAEAAKILEKSIGALHFSIASASFFASSFFYAGTAGVNVVSGLSINALSTLNAIFGCTETSRAVATIITLVRSEFRNDVGETGAPITYWDLLVGIVGFVLLQRWGRRKTDREFRENGGEEIIWDTIVDDRGFRADVVGTQKTEYFASKRDEDEDKDDIQRARSFISPSGDEEINVVERTGSATPQALNISLSPIEQARLTDDEIKQHILAQLPAGVHATITSETVTAKTIRVDIFNTEMADISAPPGTVIIAESVHRPQSQIRGNEEQASEGLHQQTIVFQTSLRRSNSSDMKPIDKMRMTPNSSLEPEDVDDPEDALTMIESPRTSPRNSPVLTIPSGRTNQVRHSPSSPVTIVANQKKARRPANSRSNNKEKPKSGKLSLGVSAGWAKVTQTEKSEKEGPLKKVMKNLSPKSSSANVKDGMAASSSSTKEKSPPPNEGPDVLNNHHVSPSRLPRLVTSSQRPQILNKSLPPSPPRDTSSLSKRSRSLAEESRTQVPNTYFTVRESRRNSLVSQIDTYSLQPHQSRPISPTFSRNGAKASNGLSKATSERNISAWEGGDERPGSSNAQHHRRSRSFIQSLYSVATTGSEGSLIVQPRTPVPHRSIFDDHETVLALTREGKTPGIFPNAHLVQNIRRYHRFSSASYGPSFLRFMGLVTPDAAKMAMVDLEKARGHHDEHASFSMHTGLPPETIIFSSFADPIEGPITSDPSGAHPLVHFVSVDHDFKAVVLTCRGTLGIQDVLTDMICDYDNLEWRGTTYQVHRGILASARRLVYGPGSRVFATLKHAMEEYPEYGLVLTGHSLGGAVAAVLGILIAEPSSVEKSGALFATATPRRLIAAFNGISDIPPVNLPPNRPLHVYAYGPPAILSPSLRLATRGLITSTVNSADIVPSLSLGNLQDMRNVALTLKNEGSDSIRQVSARVWSQVVRALRHSFYVKDPPPLEETGVLGAKNGGIGGDPWAWAALKTLRACMDGNKLVPPGEVFVIESMRVLDRQGTGRGPSVNGSSMVGEGEIQQISLGRPATRIQLKYIRDVETRFGEVRFGSGMFADHSPTRYEANLAALTMGVVEDSGART